LPTNPPEAAEVVASGDGAVTPALRRQYRRNLDALVKRQPRVAELIDQAPRPDGCVEAVGRDGFPTFRLRRLTESIDPVRCATQGRWSAERTLPCEGGRRGWLGDSSMPSISAPAILEGVVSDGSNLVLPGAGTGWEATVLLEKSWPHVAVFVLESDPLLAKLALHVRDLSEAIARGRIVLLVGDDPVGALETVIAENPGYVFPTKLVRVTQRPPAETSAIQTSLEAAGARAAAVYQSRIDEHAARIRSRTRDATSDEPSVALLCVDASPRALGQVRRIERALDHLGWRFETCAPDRPDRCHLTARLAAIDFIEADIVLLVDSIPGALAEHIPDSLPSASWILPGARIDASAASRCRQGHGYFCATQEAREALIAAGLEADRITRLDVGADHLLFEEARRARAPDGPSGERVAVFADLPDARPQACGLTMPSHVQLFEEVRSMVGRRIEGFSASEVDSLLTKAVRKTGIRLTDDVLRWQFIEGIQRRVWPRLIGEHLVRVMIDAGRRVSLWGSDWSAFREDGLWHGSMPDAEGLRALAGDVDVAVFPLPDEGTVQNMMDSMLGGVRVACLGDRESFDTGHPGLSSMSGEVMFSPSVGALIKTLLTEQWHTGDGSAGRSAVVGGHMIAHRLETSWRTVRAR
jgi:hypothetical protein